MLLENLFIPATLSSAVKICFINVTLHFDLEKLSTKIVEYPRHPDQLMGFVRCNKTAIRYSFIYWKRNHICKTNF